MSMLSCEPTPQHDVEIVDRRFMVVDDFGTMRRIISGLLQQLGACHVEEAEDGVQAFEKLVDDPVDFVISDWNMPRMTGLDLLKKVRADAVWPTFRSC